MRELDKRDYFIVLRLQIIRLALSSFEWDEKSNLTTYCASSAHISYAICRCLVYIQCVEVRGDCLLC
jgi:hypothetical protein